MLKNIRKYLEYGLFIIINIGLIAPVYSKFYLLAAVGAYDIALNIFSVSEDIILHDDPSFLISLCCFSLSLTILKPILFQILYIFGVKLHFIHAFLDKLRNDIKFLMKILFISFIVDALFTYISQNIFSLFFGLLFNYLTFYIFFYFYKNKKIIKITGIIFIGIILFFLVFPFILFLIFILLDFLSDILGLINIIQIFL